MSLSGVGRLGAGAGARSHIWTNDICFVPPTDLKFPAGSERACSPSARDPFLKSRHRFVSAAQASGCASFFRLGQRLQMCGAWCMVAPPTRAPMVRALIPYGRLPLAIIMLQHLDSLVAKATAPRSFNRSRARHSSLRWQVPCLALLALAAACGTPEEEGNHALSNKGFLLKVETANWTKPPRPTRSATTFRSS